MAIAARPGAVDKAKMVGSASRRELRYRPSVSGSFDQRFEWRKRGFLSVMNGETVENFESCSNRDTSTLFCKLPRQKVLVPIRII